MTPEEQESQIKTEIQIRYYLEQAIDCARKGNVLNFHGVVEYNSGHPERVIIDSTISHKKREVNPNGPDTD